MYIPPESGLGAREQAALRRLTPGAFSVLAGELGEPGSWPTVRRILRDSDPERALVRQMSLEVDRAVAAHRAAVDSGLGDAEIQIPGDGLGNFFKRIGKAIRRHVQQVVKLTKRAHATADPIYRTLRRRPSRSSSAPAPVGAPVSTPPVETSGGDWSQAGAQIVSASASSAPMPPVQYVQEQPPADPAAPQADAAPPPVETPVEASQMPAAEAKSGSGLVWLLLAGSAAALVARHR